jgi:hypothetical protein
MVSNQAMREDQVAVVADMVQDQVDLVCQDKETQEVPVVQFRTEAPAVVVVPVEQRALWEIVTTQQMVDRELLPLLLDPL